LEHSLDHNTSYQLERHQLLFEILSWVLKTNQVGSSSEELARKYNRTEWELQHLFMECIGKSPIQFVQDAYNPQLFFSQPSNQLSIFEETFNRSKPSTQVNVLFSLNVSQFEPAQIYYQRVASFLGTVFIAVLDEGCCQLTFEDAEDGINRLSKTFPKSEYLELEHPYHQLVKGHLAAFFTEQRNSLPTLNLFLKGTPFQSRVWHSLMEIESGKLQTYSTLAEKIGDQNASRAVGTAVGANPIAVFIPCHRVVAQTGQLGHFRWGTWRKHLLCAIER
jgi:AraC family transcriptional regulator of adaptative response/methylated-DNA-[protein]-cysteine methyltransferase